MTGRARGTIAALTAVGALALAGCGTNDTAAIVNGQRISLTAANAAAKQVNDQFSPTTPLTTTDALNLLIIAPTIIEASAKAGRPQTAQAARTQFTKVSDPDPASVELVQANSALQGFDASSEKDLLAQIARLRVTVSPRFGTFDAAKPGIVGASPAWIVKSAG